MSGGAASSLTHFGTPRRKVPRPIDEQQIEQHVVEKENVHEDEAEQMEREHHGNENPAVMGRGQAKRRGNFKKRDEGQAASKHEDDQRPFGDVPTNVGVEVVTAQAGVDGPYFHGVACED